ncbi:hypothetical protein C0Q70_19161 [Pomacea canaliculata]|uniref:Uncharacterized protein n=1 Tax=Pomacea canaliculata TaxID=400727 RepID=A0A2T7NIJ5_POMCA|nr:hypothetical protein C0Q70_19161 [Pomacea canaliculata]
MHPTKIRWRESSPVASTTFAFLVGLLTTVVCAWPCGIIAVIAAKRARDSVAIGDFTRARRLVQNALIYSALSLIFGLIMWLVICWRTDVIVHSALRHGIADCH